MAARVIDQAIPILEESIWPLSGATSDYNPLLELIGDARYVLLGEATHGTHEFYKARAEITKRLIVEKAFTAVAWEADWPDALRVIRYVGGSSQDASAIEALAGFKRFPRWMWRNADILDLVGWLRAHNSKRGTGPKVGVYGLDLYSLRTSMDAVIHYLEETDPEAANAARRRYGCFEDFDDPPNYGMTAGVHESLSCENEVVEQLVELQRHSSDYLSRDGRVAADELFFAKQNARVAINAEHYYRAMYHGRPNTWNLRDTHMVDTLDEFMRHLEEQGERPKAVVWAHNSHLGDARATQMAERGELNVGQLMRERHGREAVSVGFTTYAGTVTAASEWDGVAERKHVRPGMDDSYELLFHQVGVQNFLLPLRENRRLAAEFARERLERAIGVIYKPETERWSHYFHANLPLSLMPWFISMRHALSSLWNVQPHGMKTICQRHFQRGSDV
ncbi:MAG TPA: erythromycin esterase family protein [Methylomirabilota bacterium]|nr:erythromycin esterase family protein [Methylomirabilota bacterium]